MHALFLTRLGLYLLAVLTPLLHPAVAIPYDRSGVVIWFALVPLQMLLAYLLRLRLGGNGGTATAGRFALPVRRLPSPRTILLGAVLGLLVAVVAGTGFDSSAWSVIVAGGAAFVLTLLVFSGREYGYALAGVETFFLGYVYLKMLRFSRASAEIASESSILTTVLMLLAVAGFLLHGIVLYQAAFHRGQEGRRRLELAIFAAVSVPLLLGMFLLPADFVENSFAFNRLNELPPRPPQPIDDSADAPPGGNLRGEEPDDQDGGGGQGEEGQDPNQNRGPGLEGIPADEWDDRVQQPTRPGEGDTPQDATGGSGGTGSGNQGGEGDAEGEGGNQGEGDGDNKQYAVMVIASSRDPVYAADAYFGVFHPEDGFTYTQDEPLNDLTYQRLLDTWEGARFTRDRERQPREYFFYSTIPERVMPYQPAEIEPTVQRRRYHPFSFSYRVVSNVSESDARDWSAVRPLNGNERQQMARYLEVDLEAEQRERFMSHAQAIVGDEDNYFGKIDLILQSFSTCQYKIGFTDDVSVSHVDDFLFETRAGDCTEFSNSAAILGRLLGIPSRVVTGYLGTESLQTPQHLRALSILRQSIEPLQQFALEDLFLITTSHRHSWTQFWIPGYGWVDFETTTYAQQPLEGGDANNFDIVIPIIEVEEVVEPPVFVFPWRFVLMVIGGLAVVGLASAYGLRYGRQLLLTLRARRPDAAGVRANARLLYMRMARNGFPLKPRADTALEYAQHHPHIGRFATLYTMLRYRQGYSAGERDTAWQQLRDSYREASKGTRAPGLRGFLSRVFSLRPLYY